MTGRLTGRSAIVTGGASGIGLEVSERLAQEGARVLLADIDITAANRVAATFRAAELDVDAHEVDIANEDSVAELMRSASASLGKLDILCNIAALTSPDYLSRDVDVMKLDVGVWDHTLRVNLTGTMLCCKHAIGRMIASGGGVIINTSSGASLAGDSVLTSYGVSKAGVNILTKSIATQYGRAGIRCNAVCPGPIVTRTSPPGQAEFMKAQFDRVLPTGYLGSGSDIASISAFLASDESRYITGQIISVDGGLFAHQPTIFYSSGT